jgi:sulfate adenylyltransferase large subunit
MATFAPEPVSVLASREASEVPEILAPRESYLRFTTAGSVDDGKSTLIGRLLYDSQAVYEDQLASVRKSRINRSTGAIDFSLLTDGLRAEREQGITIDVAYRYFSTPRRKFIIADTPGHEQYTRNMATGASTADAAVVLLDATKGVLQQSRRHAFIANLLGVRHIVAAVNKMDLVDYRQEVFEKIAADFRAFAEQLGVPELYAVPISALEGDNVVRRSARMDWFSGPSLLEFLETVPLDGRHGSAPMRFPVQYVVRPDANFRGFAGELASGTLYPGKRVVALPSGVKTRIKSIVTFAGELESAGPGTALSVTLDDEIDLSRGDLLTEESAPPSVAREFTATLVWMHADRLDAHKNYLLKHTTRTVRARISRVEHRVDINTLAHAPAASLGLNEIGVVQVHTTLPLFFDAYRDNRSTGSFILIDPVSNSTVAAGIIDHRIDTSGSFGLAEAFAGQGRVTRAERRERSGHAAVAVWLAGRSRVAELLERALFREGWQAHLLGPYDFAGPELVGAAKALHFAGLAVIFSPRQEATNQKEVLRTIYGPAAFFDGAGVAESDEAAAERILSELQNWRATSGLETAKSKVPAPPAAQSEKELE